MSGKQASMWSCHLQYPGECGTFFFLQFAELVQRETCLIAVRSWDAAVSEHFSVFQLAVYCFFLRHKTFQFRFPVTGQLISRHNRKLFVTDKAENGDELVNKVEHLAPDPSLLIFVYCLSSLLNEHTSAGRWRWRWGWRWRFCVAREDFFVLNMILHRSSKSVSCCKDTLHSICKLSLLVFLFRLLQQ